jgi:hypothetical protein
MRSLNHTSLGRNDSGFLLESIAKQTLPDRSHVMSGELALSNFGIGVIGKYHWCDTIRDDPGLF